MASVSTTEEFDVDLFETRLEALKDTQDGIQQMSAWCLKQRGHHKKIVASWLNVLKRVRVEHRLVLFYLANDVIQYSKRKRLEFVESWATALQKATTMVRDEKVKNKILRIFSIWEQREIYNEEFLTDLCGLLNITPPKKSHSTIPDQEDFQNVSLIASVKECVELSEITDRSFKKMPKAPNCDTESIKQHLKDKSHSDDVEKELERYAAYLEAFNKNLQAEIKCRKNVLENLDTAIKFYTNQRGEVKVVVSAYKNFGSRIKLVKKKLDEITPTLSSPIPSPDINAPSPEPDTDLQLPDEQSPISMSFFKNKLNGYSSYLDGNLPFDINDFKTEETSSKIPSQPIEVIGSRSDDESFNSSTEYYKPESISAYSSNDNVMIPGLTPLPVPAVPSGGYTSLARSSQQYSDILPPPPNPPMFGTTNIMSNNLHHGINSSYTAHTSSSYNANDSYDPNPYSRPSGGNQNNSGLRIGGGPQQQPLMPPPPMPPTMGSVDVSDTAAGNNFNPAWDMSGMSWNNPLDSSSASTSSYGNTPIDTPLSPPHYDTDPHSATSTTLEYTEHDTSLSSTQDVDHRQLHLTAFGIGAKLGLSKEKSRQLDIDHRNLISLTGSPASNDMYHITNESSGDIDYRVFGQNIKTIETTINLPLTNDKSSISSTDETGKVSKTISPKKKESPSKESQKEEPYAQLTDETGGGATSGYDPTDMVVDMDMSDDDLDDIFREVNEQMAEQAAAGKIHEPNGGKTNGDETSDSTTDQGIQRPPLLETPAEYDPNTNWDCQEWSQMPAVQWQNNRGGVAGGGPPHVPPPPRPPYGMQYAPYTPSVSSNESNNPFATPTGSPVHGGRGGGFGPMGRGGGSRGWDNSPQNQFRNFPRPPRGGGGNMGGSPFFNRGRGRGGGGGGGHLMIRGGGVGGPGGPGGFRGKFRGKNNWI